MQFLYVIIAKIRLRDVIIVASISFDSYWSFLWSWFINNFEFYACFCFLLTSVLIRSWSCLQLCKNWLIKYLFAEVERCTNLIAIEDYFWCENFYIFKRTYSSHHAKTLNTMRPKLYLYRYRFFCYTSKSTSGAMKCHVAHYDTC